MGVRSFKCGSLGVWNMIELMGHCMQSQVSLFVCAYVHMSEVKAQMNNPYQFIQVERATALVLWLHHDDRCHGRDLSSAAWDSFCSTHPPVVSPVSKSLRDQCVFTPVVMFFFLAAVLLHLGCHTEDERRVAQRERSKRMCEYFPPSAILSTVLRLLNQQL